MKTKRLLLFILLAIAAYGCEKSDDAVTLPAELNAFKESVTLTFDTLDTDIRALVEELVQAGGDTSTVRAGLKELVNATTFETDFGYITNQGILQLLEPEIYHEYEGADISAESAVIEAFESEHAVLSDRFLTIQGLYGVADIYPVVNNGQVSGAISCLFNTEFMLGRAAAPLLIGQTFELWVMEKNGCMIYNQDEIEIGLNIFTDPYYEPFTELITAAHKIADGESGETSYSFYQTGTTTVVTKQTFWTTLKVHETEWKFVWVKPI
jgi:hypothetical protein